MTLDEELQKKARYRWEFIRRNKELFENLKKEREQHYLKIKGRRKSSKFDLTSYLEEDSLLRQNFLTFFPANFLPYFMEDSSFEIPETAPTFLPEMILYDLSPIEVLFYGENDKDRVATSMSFFYPEGDEKFLQEAVESRKLLISKSFGTRFPILSIDAVDKGNKTITIKIHLDRKKKEILRDMGLFLDILKREAKDYNIDLKRPKPHWDIFDKFLEVYDLRRENRKKWSWSKLAKEMFPEEPLGPAIDKVRHYDRQAKKMISGGWRQI
jgi:hypothetical protein